MTVRIGVIGGGQLARMMIPPALHLGLRISVLAETEGSSAERAADVVGDYRDPDTVYAFAQTVDVVTFDHEHVPGEILEELQRRGHAVHPAPQTLIFAQDKIRMRERLSELGAPVPAWRAVTTSAELDAFIAEQSGSAVVKTARGGYDGKGVRVVTQAAQVSEWFAQLGAGEALLAEERVDFVRELSQLIARSPSGEAASWPVVETVQRDGVCAEVYAPAPGLSLSLVDEARRVGSLIASGLDVTGVLAVEMFETREGHLIVNELAMRPHNSGHFTIEGSVTSQFEQHLRAVADLPLGDTSMTAPVAVMANVLGGPPEGTMATRYASVLAAHPRAHVHSYDKTPRPGRKVGHITVTGSDFAETRAAATACANDFL